MRKVLIIALGLASLATLGGVQLASAGYEDGRCLNLAIRNPSTSVCTPSAGGTKVCKTNQAVFDFIYNRCVRAKVIQAAQQKASKQQLQNAVNAAQTPTGILGSGKPARQAK